MTKITLKEFVTKVNKNLKEAGYAQNFSEDYARPCDCGASMCEGWETCHFHPQLGFTIIAKTIKISGNLVLSGGSGGGGSSD